jgi:hypothetical protein
MEQYLAAVVWRLENMAEADRRASQEASARLLTGWLSAVTRDGSWWRTVVVSRFRPA